ncbi:putative inner membrane protein [Clostridium liquoris]|uniref:Putative inner membrane protein n=1 Tax=Clostridium liquoris TaxID=1289519 RepID=A0A2T0B7W7_9CLOT|nr:YeeE/YedE thiosulfate transporter family protein [Clostridium liquoris]PRR79945.1 putative inner membrane protein [Clostridium liquoris]
MINDMDLLIQQRQMKTNKKQKNQIPYAISIFLIALAICAFLWKYNYKYIPYWIIGIGFGVTLRYSRFCFSAALRDFIILRNTKLLKALLLAMMVSTVGFGIIQYIYLENNPIDYIRIPGSITSVGPHIAIGAFIFGIGMTIAGGCSSTILTRIGEGHAFPWVVSLGFIIGNILGANNYSFWYDKIISNTKVIYFPEYVDLRIVVILQLVVLMILYRIASGYENKKN